MNNIIESLDSYMLSNNFINKFEAYRLVPPEQVTVRPKRPSSTIKLIHRLKKNRHSTILFFIYLYFMCNGEFKRYFN